METSTTGSRTTPKDFFLWLLAVIALYGSIISFIALLFEYINYSFPDALAGYADPYGGAVRFSMAALIVLVPTTVVIMHYLRRIIIEEPGKAQIWVRRWAIGLTLFIATLTILIDLVTLINTFLNGEITVRFGLKVLTVLAVAVFIFFHTLLDMKGYWIKHGRRAHLLGGFTILVSLIAVVAGFFIVGTPGAARDVRFDIRRVNDLQMIQGQVLSYYQQKQTLPDSLSELEDPLAYFTLPADPETNADYVYKKTGDLSFELCAVFAREGKDLAGRGGFGRDIAVSYPYPGPDGAMENWQHGEGQQCFERTIDPERYPPFEKPILR
ncbi:MAG TPA: DUF5671 domain-containing protein [Candidatus Paceibacterota bacterium]|nr:DUF5671 domain-containing protein [Candidatus Paceibacterota bacterium]